MSKILGAVFGTILLIVVISFLVSYPMMLLWNSCLVPAFPGMVEVSWLQMWGISLLIGALNRSDVKVTK